MRTVSKCDGKWGWDVQQPSTSCKGVRESIILKDVRHHIVFTMHN